MIGSVRVVLCLLLSSLASAAQAANLLAPVTPYFSLDKGWAIQISSKVNQTGDVVSSQQFKPEAWIPTKIPSTVVAAQIAAGEFPDPFLRAIFLFIIEASALAHPSVTMRVYSCHVRRPKEARPSSHAPITVRSSRMPRKAAQGSEAKGFSP